MFNICEDYFYIYKNSQFAFFLKIKTLNIQSQTQSSVKFKIILVCGPSCIIICTNRFPSFNLYMIYLIYDNYFIGLGNKLWWYCNSHDEFEINRSNTPAGTNRCVFDIRHLSSQICCPRLHLSDNYFASLFVAVGFSVYSS